jgi:hypothetical protein
MQKQRRDFLKITAAGAAGLALTRADRAFAAWPSTGTLAVNPTISNMRVVGCVDTKMMKSTPQTTFAAENAAVDSARLQANMDAMAMQLANQTTADAAWKAIFRSSKDWAATKVAIKINSLEPKNAAHIAIVQKFCTVLAGLGVLPANIIIYDGQTAYAGNTSNYASYISLTDTTKIAAVLSNQNSSMGGTVSAPIPGGSNGTCTAAIANGTIDILINIANNKGHDLMGRATLCMKNHFGTFAPKHDINYLFNINKSDAILGGTPVRQQLCFVDSLFANKTQNVGTPEVMPCYLVMGVFAPAVDYLTIKKVREEVMGCTHDAATINSYLTTFGYATTDPVWVLVPPASGATGADGGAGGAGGSGGTSGAGGAGSGGTSASGGARSGGASGSGGTASGGTSGSGGTTASGGTSSAGGVASGGTSGSGGARSGGSNAAGGAGSGGTSGSGGAASGGTSGSSGARSGGATATGGTPTSGGTTSGSAGGAGGAATSVASASGGSASTGGTSAGAGTSANATGGSSGSTASANSGSGCDIAGVDRKVTRWGAMLAFGAVVAEKLRRLVGDSDRSS